MNSYQNNTSIVLNYLSGGGGKNTSYQLAHSCFAQLENHLVENGLPYSEECAHQWLARQSKSAQTMRNYAKALRQLEDVYQVGHVRFVNRTRLVLTDAFDGLVL